MRYVSVALSNTATSFYHRNKKFLTQYKRKETERHYIYFFLVLQYVHSPRAWLGTTGYIKKKLV